MRKTKIICTIGPATSNYDKLKEMYEAGMNIIRLNMSHATHKWADRMIDHIVELNKHTTYPVGILLDTQGPEIRTSVLENDLNLKTGDEISISVRDGTDVEESSFRINYDELIDTVKVGDKITVDNGLINLEVLEKNPPIMRCKVIDGGKLTRVPLKSPVPVHLTYSTVWIGEGGTVNFRDDIYGRDAQIERALTALETAVAAPGYP